MADKTAYKGGEVNYKVVCIKGGESTSGRINFHIGGLYNVVYEFHTVKGLISIRVEDCDYMVSGNMFVKLDEWRDRKIGEVLNG